ncbi:MAG: Panacea domain-containing protein [Candidatus Bathyarchaeia archaeon]
MLVEKIPDRGWIPLYTLFKVGKISAATKLQKLIFLIQTEGKIDGYKFFKHHYGPYSEELVVDVQAFSKSLDLIDVQVIEGTKYPYYEYSPTAKGIETIQEIAAKLSLEDLKRADKIINKYKNKNYKELTEYIYKQYVIPEQTFETLYSSLSADLVSLDNIWEKYYKDDCPASLLILAVVEYSSKALEKLKTTKDPVVRGVCVSSISELTAKIVDLTSSLQTSKDCPFSFKTLLTEISDHINFLDNYCGKNNILPDILDIDFSDFMSEEELQRLEKTLAETQPSELMY